MATLTRAASRAACAGEHAEAGRWLRALRHAAVAVTRAVAAGSGMAVYSIVPRPKAAEWAEKVDDLAHPRAVMKVGVGGLRTGVSQTEG